MKTLFTNWLKTSLIILTTYSALARAEDGELKTSSESGAIVGENLESSEEIRSSDILFSANDEHGQSAELNSEDTEPLLLPYRPDDYADQSQYMNFTRSQLMSVFVNALDAKMPEDHIVIPAAPTQTTHLHALDALTDHELLDFLRKKQSFLNRFAGVLKTLHFKPKTINKALAEVNEEFFDSATLIARSNTIGSTVMFSLSGGLALPKKFTEKLKERPLGKFLPESGGFYYLLGFGAGITRVTNPNTQKAKWYLELFMDTESLKNTLSGLVELSAAGTYGVVYEYRPESFWTQKMETTYGGLAGLFKRGPNQFGWAASTGLSAPPGIGAFLIYQDHTTRRYFLRLNISPLFLPLQWSYKFISNSTRAFGQWVKNPTGRSCSQLFIR